MKLCPNCKAAIDENARFCLSCMTALDTKEQIQPPARKKRRWPLVFLCIPVLCGLLLLLRAPADIPEDTPKKLDKPAFSEETASPAPSAPVADNSKALTQTIDGVTYTFRPATREDYPDAISLEYSNYYVLIRVEGTPVSGIYSVPSFVNEDYHSLVTVVADGAFDGTDARMIDLGHNVRHVWGDAFGGYPLTDLYLHTDVHIDRDAFSGCTGEFSIHCPEYLENTQGVLWTVLAAEYGFVWISEVI